MGSSALLQLLSKDLQLVEPNVDWQQLWTSLLLGDMITSADYRSQPQAKRREIYCYIDAGTIRVWAALQEATHCRGVWENITALQCSDTYATEESYV